MELLLAGAAVAGCAGAVWSALARSRADRRLRAALDAVTARLAPDAAETDSGATADDLGRAVARLGRAANRAVARSDAAQGLADALAAVLRAVPIGVVVSAPDGRTLLRNEAADRLLGTRGADALAHLAVSELLAEAAAGRPATRPLDLYGPPRRTLSLTAVPVEGAAAVVALDVSDRLRLEEVRRDFVANVSHELKTPVAALGLLAETLSGEDDPEVVHRLASRMQGEAFRVARIIEDLLDLSRLEADEAHPSEPVHLRDLVSAAVEQVQSGAALRSVVLDVAETPPSWSVPGDARQLVSAVVNLLENAVKYSDAGSVVHVAVRRDAGTFDLVVRDTGIGIPSRDLDRIFERFYRVDRGRGRDTGGTGLGLSIVRHVASNHGGEVMVHSVEGEGSSFTLRLPARPASTDVAVEAG